MRLPAALLVMASLAGCTATAPQPRTVQAQQELDRYLSGRVAGKAQRCLPNYRADNMIIIDQDTVLFRDGARVWRSEIPGGCPGLGRSNNAIVTRQFGSGGLCGGEPFQLIDTSSNIYGGSCSFGDFVPFTRPR